MFNLQGLRVTPLPLNHSKLTFGYLLESAHSRLARQRQLDERRRQLDERQRQLDRDRRQLESDQRRLDDSY